MFENVEKFNHFETVLIFVSLGAATSSLPFRSLLALLLSLAGEPNEFLFLLAAQLVPYLGTFLRNNSSRVTFVLPFKVFQEVEERVHIFSILPTTSSLHGFATPPSAMS